MGDDEIYKHVYEKLTQNMDKFDLTLSKTLEAYIDCQNRYKNSMQNSLDQIEYFNQGDLVKLHQNLKNEAISEVCTAMKITKAANIESIFYEIKNIHGDETFMI